MDTKLEELDRILSQAQSESKAEKAAKVMSYMASMSSLAARDTTNDTTPQNMALKLMELVERHGLEKEFQDVATHFGEDKQAEDASLPRVDPLQRLLCANNDTNKFRFCPKNGNMSCAACRLVSYCSAACQKVIMFPRHLQLN